MRSGILFLCGLVLAAGANAASIQYNFTFNATSVSAATSYSLITPALLSGNHSFTASQVHLISAPASGATLVPTFPIVLVDSSGAIGAEFFRSSSSTGWDFTAQTAPLSSLGRFTLKAGSSVVTTPTDVSEPLTGAVTISQQVNPGTPVPEPREQVLFAGAGLLCWAVFRATKNKASRGV